MSICCIIAKIHVLAFEITFKGPQLKVISNGAAVMNHSTDDIYHFLSVFDRTCFYALSFVKFSQILVENGILFISHLYLMPLARVISQNFATTFGMRQLEWWDNQVVKKSNDLFSHFDIDHECDLL